MRMKSVTSHGRSGMKTSVLCSSQSRALVNEERAMIAFFRHVYYSIYSFLFSFHPVLLSKRLARFDSPPCGCSWCAGACQNDVLDLVFHADASLGSDLVISFVDRYPCCYYRRLSLVDPYKHSLFPTLPSLPTQLNHGY
jgi:hypothetical protein